MTEFEGHTKGPWTLCADGDDDGGGEYILVWANDAPSVEGHPIALVLTDAVGAGRPVAEYGANARLIAAAPALLARAEKAEAELARTIMLHEYALNRVQEIQAQRNALAEALAPFATEAAKWPDYVPDGDYLFIAAPDDIEPLLDEMAAEQGRASCGISFSNDTVTVGDLRRARAAIARLGETE